MGTALALTLSLITLSANLGTEGIFAVIERTGDVRLLGNSIKVRNQEVEDDCSRQREREDRQEERNPLHDHLLGWIDLCAGVAPTDHAVLNETTSTNNENQE